MQDKYNGEKVLVVKRAIAEDLGCTNPDSCIVLLENISKLLESNIYSFIHRKYAECDSELKQLIPYVVFKCGDEIFSYLRGNGSGESRLNGNRSVGVGGHINPEDEYIASEYMVSGLQQICYWAAFREIEEEVCVTPFFEMQIICGINDDSNDVGKVHFGIVFLCELNEPIVKPREEQISESGFMKISDLAGDGRDELEGWSKIVVDFLLDGYKDDDKDDLWRIKNAD